MPTLTLFAAAHSGIAPERSGFALSDAALFAAAALALWFVRRALRRRFRARDRD